MQTAVLAAALGALVALLAAALFIVARPPRMRSAGDLALHRLAEGVFYYRGYFSNSAVLVFPRSVVIVDSQVSPLAAARLRKEIERVTKNPIRYVINTHYHGDHTGGNASFPEAEIIAGEETARLVKERDGERVEYANTFGLAFAEVHPTIGPSRTFRGKLELEIDGDRLEILQLGRVETPDASIVFWPKMGVVACGDGVATHDYPYLGVPFLDEGLRDDGSWLGYLEAIRRMGPRILIPGHGPALAGEGAIKRRLDLLASLFRDLLGSVREELAKATPIAELVERVDRRLRHYRARSDLKEHTVSQRFAIYRCVNNMIEERKGRGWWHDLRPSVIERAPREDAEHALAALERGSAAERDPLLVHVRALVADSDTPLAISLLELWLERAPGDARALGLLADVHFDAARHVRPRVDATEHIAAATRAAKRAFAIDPTDPLALLNLGAAEIFGAMVLAQPMAPGIQKLEAAIQSGTLDAAQQRRARFFLGRAHQLEERTVDSDAQYARILPSWARFLYPLVRERIRAYP